MVGIDTLEVLLDRGADASAKDNKGDTARDLLEINLEAGCRQTNKEKVQQLVQRLLRLEQRSPTTATNDL